MVNLQDIDLLNFSTDKFYDIKIVFKMDYRPFKGVLSLIVGSEEFEIFTPEIKSSGIIYTVNGWATFEVRMVNFDDSPKSLALKLTHPEPLDLDLRLGQLSIVPTSSFNPTQISLT